jgi:hypothetical protein
MYMYGVGDDATKQRNDPKVRPSARRIAIHKNRRRTAGLERQLNGGRILGDRALLTIGDHKKSDGSNYGGDI